MFPDDGVDGGAGLVSNDSVPQDTAPVGGQQAPTGENPAWGELLGNVPSSLHSTIKPYLEKWETGVNERFSKVQSQYDPYKPFLEVDPQQITASMELARMIASDPRSFYDKMTDHYGAEWGLAGQGQQEQQNADDYSLDGLDEEDGNDIANNPLLQKIQEQQDLLANVVARQLEERQQQQYEVELANQNKQIDTELATVASTYKMAEIPQPAMKMMFSLCAANEGLTLTQAAEEVMPLFANQNQSPAARILTPGGGVPANNIDPAKLSPTDTRSLVMQMLAEANKNG